MDRLHLVLRRGRGKVDLYSSFRDGIRAARAHTFVVFTGEMHFSCQIDDEDESRSQNIVPSPLLLRPMSHLN